MDDGVSGRSGRSVRRDDGQHVLVEVDRIRSAQQEEDVLAELRLAAGALAHVLLEEAHQATGWQERPCPQQVEQQLQLADERRQDLDGTLHSSYAGHWC